MTTVKSKKSRGAQKESAVHGVIQQLPLSKLRLSPRNVRSAAERESDQDGIAALAESIAHVGVIQNLVVTAQPDGLFDVEAGGRRLAACQLLLAQGRVGEDYPVHALVVADEAALTASLTENTLRKDMNPVDEFLAFQQLVANGKPVEDVAAAFGVSPAVVRRRLKLANVSPRLLNDFREGEVNLEQLMALAVVDDHAAQEAAFYEGPDWQRNPGQLKRRLLVDQVAATSALGRFVGEDAYRAAGGNIVQDLFAADGQGVYFTDPALVEQLAKTKLAPLADAMRDAGWAWAEVAPTLTDSDLQSFRQAPARSRRPTEEEAARLSALAARDDEIDNLLYGDDEVEDTDALEAEQERLREEADALHATFVVYDDAVKAVTGCIVTVGSNGEPEIHYGRLRDGDKLPVDAPRSPDLGGLDTPARAKAEKGPVSEKLAQRLTAHRTMAMQASMAAQPHVALAVVVHSMLLQVKFTSLRWNRLPVGIRLDRPTTLNTVAPEIGEAPAAAALKALLAEHTRDLPATVHGLLEALLAKSQDELVQLLAVCSALSVDAVRSAVCPRSDLLAQALKLDMRQWWSATADSYFAHVSKGAILDAVRGVAPDKLDGLDKLKKGDLAKEAEQLVDGAGWLPLLLATPEAPVVFEEETGDEADQDFDDELEEDDMAA